MKWQKKSAKNYFNVHYAPNFTLDREFIIELRQNANLIF